MVLKVFDLQHLVFFFFLQDFVHSPLVWIVASWLFLLALLEDPCYCTMLWSCIHIVRYWHKYILVIQDGPADKSQEMTQKISIVSNMPCFKAPT